MKIYSSIKVLKKLFKANKPNSCIKHLILFNLIELNSNSDEAAKRKRTDSNVSVTTQEPSTRKLRCCSVCNAPGKRMTHIDCPGHYRHSLPPSKLTNTTTVKGWPTTS